jgi:hypothetical protein
MHFFIMNHKKDTCMLHVYFPALVLHNSPHPNPLYPPSVPLPLLQLPLISKSFSIFTPLSFL